MSPGAMQSDRPEIETQLSYSGKLTLNFSYFVCKMGIRS